MAYSDNLHKGKFMPTPSRIIQGAILALAVAHDMRTQIQARKNAALFLEANEAFEELNEIHKAQIKYLCYMLDKNEIPADDFDLIALHYHHT